MADVAAPSSPSPEASAPASTPATTTASAPDTGKSAAPDTSSSQNTVPGGKSETPSERKSRVLKLKIDGAEEELNLDDVPDDKLAMELQLSRAARKRMQEAAEVQKQWAAIREFIKKDPIAALKDPAFGLDIEEMVQQRLANKYREQTLPPEEQAKLQYERALQEKESEIQKLRQADEERQQAIIERQVEEEITRDFTAALQDYGLPKSKETIKMMAEVAKINHDAGIDLTPAQLADAVKEQLTGIHRHVVTGMKGQALIKYLGDDVVREVLKYSVERVKAAAPAPKAPVQTKPEDDETKPRQPKDYWATKRSLRG